MSSLPAIRAALETQLASITPEIDTAWENVSFTPTVGVPYQQVTLLPAQPANLEMGAAYTEQGLMQVNLFYPKNAGPVPAALRGEAIRAAFPIGASLSSNGITVNITNTTEIGPAQPDNDAFMIPVRIRWQARIGG